MNTRYSCYRSGHRLAALLALAMLASLSQSGCNSADPPKVGHVNVTDNKPQSLATEDAEEQLATALEIADRENKNVFVHLSGPG